MTLPARQVLDEVFHVVRYLKNAGTVERSSFTVLQELRDISSMAMEHFEEHIVPSMKRSETRQRPLSLLNLFSMVGTTRSAGQLPARLWRPRAGVS